MTDSISLKSLTCFILFASTIDAGLSPVLSIISNTSFAILPVMVSLSIKLINSPKSSALIGQSSIVLLILFKTENNSPITQLQTSLGLLFSAAASK